VTAPAATPLQQLWRQLAIGTGIGLAGGLALGAVSAAVGFPEWTVTAWSFVAVLAMISLPMALIMRALMHGVHRLTVIGIPRERRPPMPDFFLTSYWWGYVIGAAAIAAYLVLLVVFTVGHDLTTPF
jgi:hypothetical protein